MGLKREENISKGEGRYYLLDLLRFFAAMAVVFYHYSIYFEQSDFLGLIKLTYFGYLGVPFFFILSGFVITSSALNRDPLRFALSRAVRLYPAFWGGLLFAVCINFALGDQLFTIKDVLLNATILNDYFGIRNIDDVFWTLQAEIKFYGCVFLLLTFNLFKSFYYWATGWLILAVIHYFTSEPSAMGMFINPSYSFYFIGGVCCCLIHKHRGDIRLILMLCIATVFSMLVAYGQVKGFYPSASELDHIIVMLVVLSFYVLFYLLAIGKMAINPFYGVRFLGAISYPLYLIHNFSGKLIINELMLYMPTALAVLITLVCILLASTFIHLLIEKKLSPIMLSSGNNLIKRLPKF